MFAQMFMLSKHETIKMPVAAYGYRCVCAINAEWPDEKLERVANDWMKQFGFIGYVICLNNGTPIRPMVLLPEYEQYREDKTTRLERMMATGARE